MMAEECRRTILLSTSENQVANFTHGAISAARFGYVVRGLSSLFDRIGDRYCQARALHQGNVHEIIADVRRLFLRHAGFAPHLFHRLQLFSNALANVGDSEVTRASLCRSRRSA